MNRIFYLFKIYFNGLRFRIRSSMENLVDDSSPEGLVTFPDDPSDGDLQLDLVPDDQLQNVAANGLNSSDTVKFEQKRTLNTSKTKILTNGFSSEQVC
jgi:hypothetical protein